jgi:hypothetical protein
VNYGRTSGGSPDYRSAEALAETAPGCLATPVIVLDLSMPGGPTLAAIPRMLEASPVRLGRHCPQGRLSRLGYGCRLNGG